MASEDQLKDKIKGRREAESLLEMLQNGSEHYRRGVAAALRLWADSVLGTVETELRVMSDQEAEVFERHTIGFGIHQDQPYRNIPIDYLTWLADRNLKLAAYLRSERGQARIKAHES